MIGSEGIDETLKAVFSSVSSRTFLAGLLAKRYCSLRERLTWREPQQDCVLNLHFVCI